MAKECPFCDLAADRIVISNVRAHAIRDGYPVSPGHTLVILKRHVESLFDVTEEELGDIQALVNDVRDQLVGEFNPDGFNIGVNDGVAAGQTVLHLHVHVIPRYEGDREDPRGGIRWIFPDKAQYWAEETG